MSEGWITLVSYVDVLEEASKGKLQHAHQHDETDPKRRVIKELLDSGLLSDSRHQIALMTIVDQIVLTPAGATALIEWSDYLKQQTLWHKVGRTATQLAWVLVGAIAASIPKLFGM